MKHLAVALLLFPAATVFADDPSRGPQVVIAGDSYSAGTVGNRLLKGFQGQGLKVSRYGVSSSFVKHWVQNGPDDKFIPGGTGVDWITPSGSGGGPVKPNTFPKLVPILKGEAKNAKRLIIILGTNGLCEGATVTDAGKLAKQAKEAVPGIQCTWVGPKLFTDKNECGGDIQKQKQFSQSLGQAVQGGGCKFVDSTGIAPPGTHPHAPGDGDKVNEWADAVWQKVQ
jgi:hypothetical protein